jgi:hypothetical protein
VSAPNIKAVMPTNRAIAMKDPPGIDSLMLDGQKTDGRTNHARKEINPSHGAGMSEGEDGVAAARLKAVSQTIPTMRYASAAARKRRPAVARVRRMVAR